MKALTVQQPWAWAIFNGKNIENRSQLWSHRGPLAIHAGFRLAASAMHDPRILGAVAGSPIDSRCRFWSLQGDLEPHLVYGAIIGLVEVVDCHPAAGCCAPWGETEYVEFGGRPRQQIAHLVLENPSLLAEPIPCRGALGLWNVPEDIDAKCDSEIKPA